MSAMRVKAHETRKTTCPAHECRFNPGDFHLMGGAFRFEDGKRAASNGHRVRRGEVIEWIIRNQFARRNLNAMQRAELAPLLKDAVAAEAKARQIRKPKSVPPTLAEQKTETRDELAKIAGVSHGTLAKVEKIVAEAAPEAVEATRNGNMSINAAFRTVAPKPPRTPVEPSEPEADDDAPEAEERGCWASTAPCARL